MRLIGRMKHLAERALHKHIISPLRVEPVKLTYNFGYTYNNDKAIVINSNYKRHLFNVKGDYKITKNLKVGVGGRYTHQDVFGAGVSDTKGSSYNRLRNAVKYRPFLSTARTLTILTHWLTRMWVMD